MKYIMPFFLLLVTNAYSQEKTDSIAIVKLLASDYQTLGNWDIASHIKNCTSNYVLIENGEIWDMKKEAESFAKNADRIIDRKDFFDIKYIRIYGDLAYAVYNLRSEITEKGNLRIKTWTESSIFRKIEGKWKVELIHSTPIVPNQ